MSYEARNKEALEELDEIIDGAVENYEDAMRQDFAKIGVSIGERGTLADLPALLRMIEQEPSMENSIREVENILGEMVCHAIAMESARMPNHALLFINQGWVTYGYRPENAWEEAKFLEQYLYANYEGYEPSYQFPQHGELAGCVFHRSDFVEQFRDRACWVCKKLSEKDSGYTQQIFSRFCEAESMFSECWGADVDLSSCSGVIECLLLDKLSAESLADEAWEE